jgi:hypothetical protein
MTLTGQRDDDHYRIELAGQPVLLPCASFCALIDLVRAAVTTATGLPPISRFTIRRLRKALDAQIGPGVGLQLIHTGGGEEYRLVISKSRIRIAPCFYELVARKIISAEIAETLRKHCRKGKVKATEK